MRSTRSIGWYTQLLLLSLAVGCSDSNTVSSSTGGAANESTAAAGSTGAEASTAQSTADEACPEPVDPPQTFSPDMWRLVNTVHDREIVTFEHDGKPTYHVLQLQARPKDHLRIEISVDNGQPLAWLVGRKDLRAIATSESVCDDTRVATIDLEIPDGAAAHPSPTMFYLVTAERDARAANFQVQLQGGPPLRDLDAYEQLFTDYWRPQPRPPQIEWTVSTGTYEIFATASAYRRALEGAAFDPSERAAWLVQMQFAGDGLVDAMRLWRGVGWGLHYAWDAFQDGTGNPADTVYAYQNGTAIWALAELYELTGKSTYLEAAQTAMSHYYQSAYKTDGLGDGCGSCGFFLYSDNPNDAHRGVKNTNIEMAVGALILDHYAPETDWYDVGLAAAEYHVAEIRDFANYNYLSVWDPDYSPQGGLWDHHNSIETWFLLRAAQVLGRQDFIDVAIQHYEAYVPNEDDVWNRRLMACHFAPYVPSAHEFCTTWLPEHGSAESNKALGLVMRY